MKTSEIIQDVIKNRKDALYLCSLELEKIPVEIKECYWITSLYLDDNKLSSINVDLSEFKKLKTLSMRNNQLKEIPNEIFKLEELTSLNLSFNSIHIIPSEINKLKKVKVLSLSYNDIDEIPSEIEEMKELKEFYIAANNISILPPEVINIINLEYIYMDKNPLNTPPLEIVNDNLMAIRNYYEGHSEFTKLNEAKLIFVGEGETGKTSIIEKIINSKYELKNDNEYTEGISIRKWKNVNSDGEEVLLNIWDFGGQEIYYSTHQFFLTKRSLYVFVWNARKNEDIISFDYWLNTIRLLANNASIIVVLNKLDVREKFIDEATFQAAFSNIIKFQKTSVLTGEGIDSLRKTIENEMKNIEIMGKTLPKSWIDIRKKLDELHKNYIDYSEYLEICKSFNLNENKAYYFSKYFHDIGTFLHFQDNDILREIIFLKPEWATNAVYRIISDEQVQKNSGKLRYSDLERIWSEYPKTKHFQLLELMKKFELCFNVINSNEYIVPELLKPEMPNVNWDYKDNVIFEYVYDFMPAGLISRFIVRINDIIEDNFYWQNGVIIKNNSAKALFLSDRINRKITIYISGKEKVGILSIIMREMTFIHKTLNYPYYKEFISCNCKVCSQSKKPHMYNYKVLQAAILKGIYTVMCEQSFEMIRIAEILRDIFFEGRIISNDSETIENLKKGLKIMEIHNLVVNGQNIISDKIENVNYFVNNGISEGDMRKIEEHIRKLETDKYSVIKKELKEYVEIEDVADKNKKGEKIKSFLYDNGMPIIQSISAAGLFELAKAILS